jgi:iron complex transport system substrate-binding protein
MRIVSLLPAATEIVCALGLADALVGRSHECDFPEDVIDLPELTRARVDSRLSSAAIDAEVRRILQERLPIYMLDEARLAALQPDVVVTQATCEVCAISYDQVMGSVRRLSPRPTVVSLQPTRLRDVLADVRTVAETCGVGSRGAAVVADLVARLAALGARAREPRPRVAVVEWLEPLMLAGHWVPETIAAAGGVAVGPRAGEGSRYVEVDEIRGLEPDALIVAPCGFDLARTTSEAAPFADRLRRLAPRVLLMDGNAYLNRPGPRLVEAAETIAAWLRGDPVPESRAVPLGPVEAAVPGGDRG